MTDPIGQAIQATESGKQTRLRLQCPLPPSGRVAVIDVPADLNVFELVGLVSFVASALPSEIVKASGASGRPSRLEVVRGSLPPAPASPGRRG